MGDSQFWMGHHSSHSLTQGKPKPTHIFDVLKDEAGISPVLENALKWKFKTKVG